MQSIILKICVSAIVGSIIYLLVPNNNLKNAMCWTINIFLVSIILVPLISKFSSLNFTNYLEDLKKNRTNTEQLKQNSTDLMKNNFEKALKIVLTKNGYIDVDINIEINKQLNTTKIKLAIPNDEKYEVKKISELIVKETGISPTVVKRS